MRSSTWCALLQGLVKGLAGLPSLRGAGKLIQEPVRSASCLVCMSSEGAYLHGWAVLGVHVTSYLHG